MIVFHRTNALVRSALAVGLVWGLTVPAVAAHAPLLDSLLAQVRRANPRLRAYAARVDAARAAVHVAGAWDDPRFSIDFRNVPLTTPNFPGEAMETDFSVQQMIPFPGKVGAMEDAARLGVEAGERERDELALQITHDVKKNYVMLYSAQQRLALNGANRALVQQMIDAATARLASGTASQGDVLRLRIELSKLENDRTVLMHDAHMAEMMITTLRNAPGDTVGTVPDIEAFPWTFDSPDELTDTAFANRAMLKAMRADVEMARAERTAAERDRLPDFMVGGMYMKMLEGQNQYAVMVGTSIPIAPWSRGRWDGAVEKREAEALEAEARLRETETMVSFAVHDAWVKATAHWQQYQRTRLEIVPMAEQVFSATLAKYAVGTADLVTLLDAYRMITMYKMDMFMALEDYMGYVSDLELAMGKELW